MMTGSRLILVVASLLCVFASLMRQGVYCACPYDSFTDSWSNHPQWNVTGAAVIIASGEKVLMDLDATAVLGGITVNGELVFADKPLKFNFAWMKITSTGKLTIGSESCTIKNKMTLTLHGNRTTASDMGKEPIDQAALGSKGIAVQEGGSIEIHGQVSSILWTRLSQTALNGSDTLILDEQVNWKAGDSIVIASTDYHQLYSWSTVLPPSLNSLKGREFPDQNEERIIKSVSGNVVTLTSALKYTHWGQGYEKAEVGLLNRNIVIRSDPVGAADEFGGHILIRKAQVAKLSGIELLNMGQKGIMGRYPVHFHFNWDRVGHGLYVRHSSVRQSFQRCFVVHNSNGILVANNVAFDSFGHCYFLEDGAERANTFDHNLGVKVKAIDVEGGRRIIPTDVEPSVFWITNPNNTFTNNAAVGGKFGFWFSLPESPVGASASQYSTKDPYVKPRLTPLGVFDGNVAHSNLETGIHIDDMLNSDETTSLGSYTPRIPPYNDANGNTKENWDLQEIVAHFTNCISYKNRQYGTWTKGGPMRFTNFVLLDNLMGFNAAPSPTYIEDSLIVAETDNIGLVLRSEDKGRARPGQYEVNAVVKGIETYDNAGVQYARNVTFRNFISNEVRNAGALGALHTGPFVHYTKNRYTGLKFENANKVYLNFVTNTDNTHNSVIQDLDGSIVGRDQNGVAGGWVVANNSLLATDDCTARPEWNGYSCPYFAESFAKLLVINYNPDAAGMTGLDGVDYTATYKDTTAIKAYLYKLGDSSKRHEGRGARYNGRFLFETNVRARTGYTVRYVGNTPTPQELTVKMESAAIGDWMIVAIPYPQSAQPFDIKYTVWDTPYAMTPVSKLSDLKFKTYFYDSSSEHLYLKLYNYPEPQEANRYTEMWGFVDYVYDGGAITIRAACTKCTLNAAKVGIPSVVASTEDRYQADLQPCQVSNSINSQGSGVGYFFFSPENRELVLNIHHDLSSTVTGVSLYQGNPNTTTSRIIRTRNSNFSPVRAVTSLSHSEWTSLVKGELFIQVTTTTYPNGELRGRIMCSAGSSCTLPVPIPDMSTACTVNQAAVFNIYDDGPVPGWPKWYTYTATWDHPGVSKPVLNASSTDQVLCGKSSMKIDWQSGAITIANDLKPDNPNYSVAVVDTSKYDYFEFFIKIAVGSNDMALRVYMSDSTKTIGSVDVLPKYISNYKITSATGWSRVRIPLVDFKFVGQQYVGSITFYQGLQDQAMRTVYIDNMRFISSSLYPDPLTTPLSPSIIVPYARQCINNQTDRNNPGESDPVGSASRYSLSTLVILAVALVGLIL